MERAVDKAIVIARDEDIFAAARLDGSMDVSFRADVLLVAVTAQIPVRLLQPLSSVDALSETRTSASASLPS